MAGSPQRSTYSESNMLKLLVLALAASVSAFVPTSGAPRATVVRQGLLKGLDPILTADLLYTLRSMGHGDVLAVVDCNYPAVRKPPPPSIGDGV